MRAAEGSATSASSTTTLHHTTPSTLMAGIAGSPSTNKTNTSTRSSTLNVPKPATPGLATGQNSNDVIVSTTKSKVLSTTVAGSGVETGLGMPFVNYYLGIVICFLVSKKITTHTIKIK
ncbi:unnamed protein product [Mytilus coruscus]|uniref:Uncharacterized protein n=1 Tax=Mytilus coruscus TaxID=42192 RepID=A0A6J8AAI6_MYTCO|nr:unnamed protein product [Mytilus coruscus]